MNFKLLLPLVAIAALSACGPTTQAQARDAATARSCDWYERCNEIGPGSDAEYANRDDCEVDVRGKWNDMWPAAECDSKINDTELDICLKAIDITECANGFDFINTIFNKCNKNKVCSGND